MPLFFGAQTMKKLVLVLLMLFSVFLLTSQDRKADIVVLLDTSGTMLPHYTDINERVLEELCADFVRIGDTFHLISFAEKPASEISQKITNQNDVQKIVSRFSLLYPLGAYSDFLNGLLYSQQYIASLDVYTQKVLVIISDGIFNPSKNSPYFSLAASDVENSIQRSIQTMVSQGVYIYYIKAPFPQNTALKDFAGNLTNPSATQKISSGQTEQDTTGSDQNSDALTEYATKLESLPSVVKTDLDSITEEEEDGFIGNALQMPVISCPQNIGKKHYSFTLPLTITNSSSTQIILQLDKVLIDNKNVLDSTSFISIKPDSSSILSVPITLPSSYSPGETALEAQFIFADNIRTNPQILRWSLTLIEGNSIFAGFTTSTVRVLVIIAAVLACLIVLFIILSLSKKLSAAKNQEDNEQPTAVNSLNSSLGTLSNAKVSTSKLTLPVIADKVTQTAQRLNDAPVTQKTDASSNTAQKNVITSVYSKQGSLSVDASKVSSMTLNLGPKQSAIPVSESQRNSADELANFKKDQTLSITQLQSQSAASSNKLVLPQIPKASSSLSLPSIKSLGFNSSVLPASSNEKIPLAKEGTIILELYVEGQTRKIGTRNIHALSAGSRKSIGGGLSIFSIFFVKVPSNIAEIRYDGHTCSLALLKPEFFPEAETNIIEDCLNIPVKIRSEHGYLSTIMFTEYQSQTEKLNNLLLSVVPDKDKKKYL